jgi:hypothetical protein
MSEPDLKIVGLSIWVHGRQFESSDEYWDANWLRVTVHCGAHGATVEVTGSILHRMELQEWLDQARELHSALSGAARLECIEPELKACMTLTDGKGELVIDITPDPVLQKHQFRFEIDHSYLPGLCSQLEKLLARYPLRGTP